MKKLSIVNAFYILEGDHGLYGNIKKTHNLKSQQSFNNTRLELYDDHYGDFSWGIGSSILLEHNFKIYIYDIQHIVCFTSNIQNVLLLINCLQEKVNSQIQISTIDINSLPILKNDKIIYFNLDDVLGVNFTFKSSEQPWPTIVNVYPNGLTTFTMTSNKNIIYEIVTINLYLLEGSEMN